MNKENNLNDPKIKLSVLEFQSGMSTLKRFVFLTFFVVSIFAQSDLFMSGSNRPIADAGRDINTLSKGSIFLDGSKSYVSDGSRIKYHWTFSPGLVQSIDNDFSSEISVESYGQQYLKSVETFKSVLDVQLAANEPGTKLEVILMIKDRIGFEDSDTLIVEYYDPTIAVEDTLSDTLALEVDSIKISISDSDSVMVKMKGSDILIQGLHNNQINMIDAEIINSVIADQLKNIGYNAQVVLNKNLIQGSLDPKFNLECKTDSCTAKNAQIIDAGYVISWNFADSEDMFLIKVFSSQEYVEWIAYDDIPSPYEIITNTGIYGFETQLRNSVSKMMSSNVFKKEISTINRLALKNKRIISFGKYPIILGAVYLLIDKILSQNNEEPSLQEPPGFPHDGS